MKKLCYFLTVLFIFQIAIIGAWALTFDFENDDQIDSWQDLAGKMEIRDGFLCSVNAAGGPLVSMITDWKDEWSDYNIKVKAQGLIADGDWGIAFRVKDISNHYSWQFCNGSMMFVTYVGGSRTEAWTVGQAEVLNEWQDYEVNVEGNTFELYFNGKLMNTVKHDSLKTGSVGIFTWINAGLVLGDLGGAAYDDFIVEGKGIPTSKSVESRHKLTTTWANMKR